MTLAKKIYLGAICIGLIIVLLQLLNYIWPVWSNIDTADAWNRVVHAATEDNERYVIENDEAVNPTRLSRIIIRRSAWDVLKTCSDDALLQPPASITTIPQGDIESLAIQVDCVISQIRCYVWIRDKSASFFVIDHCEIIEGGSE